MGRVALGAHAGSRHRMVLLVGGMGLRQSGRVRNLRGVLGARLVGMGQRDDLARHASRALALGGFGEVSDACSAGATQSRKSSPPSSPSLNAATDSSHLQPSPSGASPHVHAPRPMQHPATGSPSRLPTKASAAAQRRCAPLRSTQLHQGCGWLVWIAASSIGKIASVSIAYHEQQVAQGQTTTTRVAARLPASGWVPALRR